MGAGAQALQAAAGAEQLLQLLPQPLLPQQRFTLQRFCLQHFCLARQQLGAAGAQQALGAEQPQPFFMKKAFASLPSITDRATTAKTMAANAANFRLILFSQET